MSDPAATKVVVTLTSRRELERALEGPGDLLEVRLDLAPDLLQAVAGCPRPILATVRSRAEGGAFAGTGQEARSWLREALAQGAALVDLELERDAPAGTLPDGFPPAQVVLSCHRSSWVPTEAGTLLARLAAAQPAVAKLACLVRSGGELLQLLDLYRLTLPVPRTILGLGVVGQASRLLARKLGAALLYAAPPGGGGPGQGQLPVDLIIGRLRLGETGQTSPVFGLVGCPLAQSAGPVLHAATMPVPGDTRASARPLYLPLELPDLEALPGLARQLDLRGLSVTAPHKGRVAQALGARIEGDDGGGSVNTCWPGEDGSWRACSTDTLGLATALGEAGVELAGRTMVILGAGGAARAAAAVGARGRARLVVVARREAAARDIAARTGGSVRSWGEQPPAALEADLVVNCTPLGLAGDPRLPCPPDAWGEHAVLVDAVYTPVWTPWLALGRLAGHRVLPGRRWFLHQALAQQRLWLAGDAGDPVLGDAVLDRELPTGAPLAFLVGLRGSGKTVVGRILAGQVGLPFLDLDEEIQRSAGQPVGRLLREHGEPALRRWEARCLEALVEGQQAPAVVATGGGTVEHQAELLQRHGTCIYLAASPGTLARRVAGDPADRPPLVPGGALGEARHLLEVREPGYLEVARVVVQTEELDPVGVARAVRQALGRVGS